MFLTSQKAQLYCYWLPICKISEIVQFLSCDSPFFIFFIVIFISRLHYLKSVRIWSFSGSHFPAHGLNMERYGSLSPYSVHIRENTDWNDSEYGHFLRSVSASCHCYFRIDLIRSPYFQKYSACYRTEISLCERVQESTI